MDNYHKYNEYQKLIAQYDWAVEGFAAPEGTDISRDSAIEIRTALIKLAHAVEL